MSQYPPTLKDVEKEIELYLQKNSSFAQVFEVYKKVLLEQTDALGSIETKVTLSEEELKNCFRNNKYIMACQDVNVDERQFVEILDNICKAIKEASPEAPDELLQLSKDPEFQAENIHDFLQQIKLMNKTELEQFVQEKQIDKRTGLDSEVITFVLFSGLSPFYSSFMNQVEEKVDFSLWRNTYCPVCGQRPVMGKHRKEDGARILECWLCHAQWGFPRLECPHCDNHDQENLRFFYVPEDKARQCHICEKCKHYLKIIDEKMLQKEVFLALEAIATGHLDVLADKEGYTQPEKAGILN